MKYRRLLIATVGGLTLFGASFVLPGCSLLKAALGGEEAVADLAALPEPEWIVWRNKATLEVKIAAQAALEEDALTASDLEKVASVLAVMGGDNPVEAGALAEWLDLSGYKAALLQLAILNLDEKLAAGGLYPDGYLGPRGKELLLHLANALQEAAMGQ